MVTPPDEIPTHAYRLEVQSTSRPDWLDRELARALGNVIDPDRLTITRVETGAAQAAPDPTKMGHALLRDGVHVHGAGTSTREVIPGPDDMLGTEHYLTVLDETSAPDDEPPVQMVENASWLDTIPGTRP